MKDTILAINLLDAGLGLVLILFIARGLIQGMVRELTGLVGVVLGFFIAKSHYSKVLPFVQQYVADPTYTVTLSYIVVFVGVLLMVTVMGYLLRKFMVLTFTDGFDHLLGGCVGFAKGFLLCVVALAILKRFVPTSPFLVNSQIAKHTEDAVEFARHILPNFL